MTAPMPNRARTESLPGTLKSLRKMVAVLECFSPAERSLTLGDITRKIDLPKSTLHRLLASLREVGFVEQDGDRERYRLGLRLFRLGSIVLANLDLPGEAQPFVRRLARISGEGVHLCVFDGQKMVTIDHREPDGRSADWVTTITGCPAYCTGVGKAALAYQSRETIEAVIAAGLPRFTRNTITDGAALLADLAEARARGYAVDNAEHQIGVRCIAAPIRNGMDEVFAAISVSGPAERITPDRVGTLAELVVDTANQISHRLGAADVTFEMEVQE